MRLADVHHHRPRSAVVDAALEIGLDDAPDAYDTFDRRVDGYTTVLLKPHS